MALSRTSLRNSISNTTGGFGSGGYTVASFTPPDNSLLVVAISFIEEGGAAGAVNDMTIADSVGLTWTSRVQQGVEATYSTNSRIWTAPVATGVSMTVTADAGTRTAFCYSVSVVAYTGYDTGTPTGATATGSQSGGWSGPPDPFSITLSGAPATASEVFAMASAGKTTGLMAPGSGWTEILDVTNTDFGGASTQVRTGSTSTTVAWADLRDGGGSLFNAAAVAVEIKEAAAGAPTYAMLRPAVVAP